MHKRYQVFVSSTFADLQDERQTVIQTVLNHNCIPAVMELFPASDEDQFKYIKRVIDYCDYYILIIGHRYGSLTPDGLSYTEQEFRYARSRGINILVFLRKDDAAISDEDSGEEKPDRDKLDNFRRIVSEGRLVKYWTSPTELPALVSLSLSATMTDFPAIGWVRADRAPKEDVLAEVNELRKERDALKEKLAALENEQTPAVDDLAGLDEVFSVRLVWRMYQNKLDENGSSNQLAMA